MHGHDRHNTTILSIIHNMSTTFISVFNQFDAQNLFHSKFYFMPLHVSSTCAHHQELKIALHTLVSSHLICFTISFISCLYMFRAHVLETCRGMK